MYTKIEICVQINEKIEKKMVGGFSEQRLKDIKCIQIIVIKCEYNMVKVQHVQKVIL